MKKNLAVALGLSIGIFLFDYFKVQDFCSFSCSRSLDNLLQSWFIISLITSFFLVVLSFLPKRIYEAWWKFTKFALPIFIILVTVQVYSMTLPRGGYQVLNFNPTILSSMYLIYIALSFIQIYRGYRSK